MIKFKQTVVTSTVRPGAMVTPPPPESPPAKSDEPTRGKRKAPPATSKNSETQLSVAFDESSADQR